MGLLPFVPARVCAGLAIVSLGFTSACVKTEPSQSAPDGGEACGAGWHAAILYTEPGCKPIPARQHVCSPDVWDASCSLVCGCDGEVYCAETWGGSGDWANGLPQPFSANDPSNGCVAQPAQTTDAGPEPGSPNGDDTDVEPADSSPQGSANVESPVMPDDLPPVVSTDPSEVAPDVSGGSDDAPVDTGDSNDGNSNDDSDAEDTNANGTDAGPLEPPTVPTTDSTSPVEVDGNPPGGNCSADSDCMAGLFCLLEDNAFFSSRETAGHIAGGLCTVRCETDADLCADFGNAATCLVDNGGTTDTSADDTGYCLEFCQVADGQLKCGGSLDQVCTPLTEQGQGACFPLCLDDLGCPQGTYCDPADGLCRDTPALGKAVGELCEQDSECVGNYCWKLNDTDAQGVCSAQCAFFGAAAGCGVPAPDAQGNVQAPVAALCFPLLQDSAENDPGMCLSTCDDADDCALPSFECELVNEEVASMLGRAGICFPQGEAAPPPPDGGAR